MLDSVKNHLTRWYQENKEYIDSVKLADLGSFNINGSTRDIINNLTGFDILEGKGVDIVINPGVIPPNHIGIYGAVTSISSFQFCPDSNLYKKQIIDLLYDEGLLFLTMCNDRCKGNHSTSPSNYKDFVDQKRYSKIDLENIFKDDFEILEIYETGEHNNEHGDLIIKAKKK